METMTKSEQLLALIEHYSGGNKAKFAAKMGLKPSSIASWITRNTFDVDIIYAKCEHISAHWLLTGEGDMLRGEGDEEIKRGGDDSLDGRLSDVGKESSSAEVIAYLVGVIQRQAEEIGCLKNMLNK